MFTKSPKFFLFFLSLMSFMFTIERHRDHFTQYAAFVFSRTGPIFSDFYSKSPDQFRPTVLLDMGRGGSVVNALGY